MERFDAVIVGGGPAGASCALWLKRLGLNPVLLEASGKVGGLARTNQFEDHWIAVLPDVTGQDVARNIRRSLSEADVDVRADQRIETVRRTPGGFEVDGTDGLTVAGANLVIASGVRARSLPGVAHGDRFAGVLIGPGEQIVRQDFTGKSVAVLGGGDNALENYGYVRERGAREVHIYARSVRGQAQWLNRVRTVDLHLGDYAVEPLARRVNGRQYDLILVFYGWEPQAPFADALALSRDDDGFFVTDFRTAQTSCAGAYAIGEVARRMHPCIATALADGVVASKAIQARMGR